MVKYFFFVFLFLLPLQTVYLLREVMVGGEKWQYGTIAIYGTDILLLLGILFYFVIPSVIEGSQKIKHRFLSASWRIGMTEKILLLFLFWTGASIFWAPDQMLAGYFFVKLLLAAGVFFLARSLDDDDVKIAFRVLIIGVVLQSLLGTWQFLSQSTFASTLLGMSAHEVWQAGTSVLKNDTGRFLRAYGTFPHPNILGGFLSAVLVLGVAYQAFQTKTQEVRGTRQDGCIGIAYLLSRISYHVSLLIILLGLILTFSRSAWLGAALGVIVYIVFRIKYHVWGKWDTRMLLTLGIATAIFVGVLHETVFPRFDGAVIEREGSVSERVQSLEDAKVVIGEGNVLLGTGAGNFTVQVMRLQPERSVWTIQPAHNVPVLVFAELGLVGLILFVAFLFSVILNAVKNLEIPLRQSADRNDNQGHSTMYIAALVVLVPILLLDHYLWTSHFGLFFLFLLLGLASRK